MAIELGNNLQEVVIGKGNLSENPIAYISSPIALQDTSSFDYFVSIINYLVEDVHNLLERELIIKVASGKSKKEQIQLFKQVLSSYNQYSAIIVSPESVKDLKIFCEENESTLKNIIYGGIPIFTIDKKLTKLKSGFQIPFITADWSYGGKLAAMAYQRLYDELKKPKGKVFIVKGGEGSEPRIRGFKYFLKKEMPNIEIRETKKRLDYSRETAFNHLYENKTNYRLGSCDLIFCCNDEMALGVREFLMREKVPVSETKIIGFDSTIEFKWLEKYNTNHLYKTVDVQLRRQVRQLVKFLSEFDKTKFKNTPSAFCHIEKPRI